MRASDRILLCGLPLEALGRVVIRDAWNSGRLGCVFPKGSPYCVCEALRVRDKASVARAYIAVRVHALPAPYAHGIVKEPPGTDRFLWKAVQT